MNRKYAAEQGIAEPYKKISFVLVSPCDRRPVMVDDTCYALSCRSKEEAELLYALLSSGEATDFLSSLIFADSKRPITIDVLRRLSIVELARELNKLEELEPFVKLDVVGEKIEAQVLLLMESGLEYRTKQRKHVPPLVADR